jgi:RNA polymerase sigma-70 factor (ECF subfamily)
MRISIIGPERAVSAAQGDFASLLDRARRSDAEAAALLVERYEAKVRLVARVLLGPALRPYLDSMDLVQSVHRSLMVGMRESKFAISTPEQLIALATTMVRRKVARQWRHMRRQQRLESGTTSTGNVPQLLNTLISGEADPARNAQSSDTMRHVWESLDESEQRILELRLDGCGTAEIAAAVGLNPIALRVRLTRLRKRLKDAGVVDDLV